MEQSILRYIWACWMISPYFSLTKTMASGWKMVLHHTMVELCVTSWMTLSRCELAGKEPLNGSTVTEPVFSGYSMWYPEGMRLLTRCLQKSRVERKNYCRICSSGQWTMTRTWVGQSALHPEKESKCALTLKDSTLKIKCK